MSVELWPISYSIYSNQPCLTISFPKPTLPVPYPEGKALNTKQKRWLVLYPNNLNCSSFCRSEENCSCSRNWGSISPAISRVFPFWRQRKLIRQQASTMTDSGVLDPVTSWNRRHCGRAASRPRRGTLVLILVGPSSPLTGLPVELILRSEGMRGSNLGGQDPWPCRATGLAGDCFNQPFWRGQFVSNIRF